LTDISILWIVRSVRYDIDKIIRARMKRGLTRKQLALRIGKHVSTISKIEDGLFQPLPTTMKKIAEELNLDMEDVVLKEARR
jgi:ribosome-binding protein aMBF1 (putative translation factor)